MTFTLKQQINNISKVFSKKDSNFFVQSSSLDELCCHFSDKEKKKHKIFCTISESASTSYMWYSESEDSRVAGVMEELSKQNNFSGDLTISKMTIYLVSKLCEQFKISPPPQLEELKSSTKNGFSLSSSSSSKNDNANNGNFPNATYKFDYERNNANLEDDDIMDITSSEESDNYDDIEDPDEELQHYVKVETEQAKKEDQGISQENQKVLSKIKQQQRQKHVKGTLTTGSIQASDRLMKELRELYKSEALRKGQISVELVNDSLYDWQVSILKVDEDSLLQKDLDRLKNDPKYSKEACVTIGISFPDNFPFDPPFCRVISPVMQGGFVLSGGAICMVLLTKQGWSSAYSIESLIVQIMATMAKGKARVKFGTSPNVYSLARAKTSYRKLVQIHDKQGWYTPPKQDG